jgi:hypothetical protein
VHSPCPAVIQDLSKKESWLGIAMHWLAQLTMSVTRHMHCLIFPTREWINGLLDWDFNFLLFADTHNCNTCNNSNLVIKPHSYKTWRQSRFICHYNVDDWNSLFEYIRTLSFNSYKIAILNFSDFLSYNYNYK